MRMPFMMAEENASGESIVLEYGAERVKQAQLFPRFHSWLSSLGKHSLFHTSYDAWVVCINYFNVHLCSV